MSMESTTSLRPGWRGRTRDIKTVWYVSLAYCNADMASQCRRCRVARFYVCGRCATKEYIFCGGTCANYNFVTHTERSIECKLQFFVLLYALHVAYMYTNCSVVAV